MLKLAIRGTMIQFLTRRKKSNQNKITLIEHKLKNIDKTLHNLTINLIHDRDEYKQVLNKELNIIRHEMAMGAKVRCGVRWAFLGEKLTKYFLNLEKSNALHKTMYRL